MLGVMVLLAIFAAGLAILSVIMFVPNGLQDQLYSSVNETNPAPSTSAMGLVFGSGAIVAIAWFFVLKILRKVVSTVLADAPFVTENISRLRRIWVIIAAAEVFRMAVHFFASLQGSGEGNIDISIGTWFSVFIIATLAEAFRYGAELRRDQELTI